jgi:protein-tyrosine phosphatase
MNKVFQRSLNALAVLFLLAQPVMAPVAQALAPAATDAHQRLLPLEGGRNFRDLGGYRTADGRTVKWGLLYRSGSMHDLTANDYAYLEKRGIRVVCDFRSPRERNAEPVSWPAAHAPTVFADDYDLTKATTMPKVDMQTLTPESARQMLAASYPGILSNFGSQYRRMFAELLTGHAPLAFNCSAGKDRTGVAAALLLTALGVPRETVIEDYLLTNRYLDPQALTKGKATANEAWTKLSPGVVEAFSTADRSYIEAALAVLDKHPGGAMGYLHDEMNLSDADITKLRGMYLQ